jgi:hypothetical protein
MKILRSIAYTTLFLGLALAIIYLIKGGFLGVENGIFNITQAPKIAPFITGFVAPLLTLASMLFVIVTIQSQTKQNFVSNFFNMLNLHHKLVDSIKCDIDGLSTSDAPSCKKDFFDDLASRIAFDFENIGKDPLQKISYINDSSGKPIYLKPNTEIDVVNKIGIERLIDIYGYYFHIYHSELGHYFRNLYHIVRFVDTQNFSHKFKDQYLSILRAQLSNYELVLLAYNGLHDYGTKFRPMIENYKLLKSINHETRLHPRYERRIIDIEYLKQQYPHLNGESNAILLNKELFGLSILVKRLTKN